MTTVTMNTEQSLEQLYDTAVGMTWRAIHTMVDNPFPAPLPMNWVDNVAAQVKDRLIKEYDRSHEQAEFIAWRALADVQAVALPPGLMIDVDKSTSTALVLRMSNGERRTIPLAQLMRFTAPTAKGFLQTAEQRRRAQH